MTRTRIAQKAAASVAAGCIGLLLVAAPASAQTYSNNENNTTNQPEDNNPGDSDGTTGGSDNGNNTGNNPGNNDDGSTPDPVDDPGGNSGTPNDGTPVGQVDEDLAFTGGDARSLALIGAGIAGAGAMLIVATRRREAEAA